MNNATSPQDGSSRKPDTAPIAEPLTEPRLSDAELRRMLAYSAIGVVVCGTAWLAWHATWLLWPGGLFALALQVSATMVAARAAVSPDAPRRPRSRSTRETAASAAASSPAAAGTPIDPVLTPASQGVLAVPKHCPPPYDSALHRAFFRRLVEADFREVRPGLVWPDLSSLQGSLSTRLRQFQRFASTDPLPSEDISQHERGPHSPWHHLAAYDAASYRRGDTTARFAHRALAPLAFLELHARIDLEPGERAQLEEDLLRLYTVGFGRVLTPPSVLSAVDPVRQRVGGSEAIALADDARLAIRATGNLEAAERSRIEWRARARGAQGAFGWSGEVLAMVEALVDYWYLQRAVADDISWAEELARLEGGTVSAALTLRDEQGKFRFAEVLREICGGQPFAATPSAGGGDVTATPTAAETVA